MLLTGAKATFYDLYFECGNHLESVVEPRSTDAIDDNDERHGRKRQQETERRDVPKRHSGAERENHIHALEHAAALRVQRIANASDCVNQLGMKLPVDLVPKVFDQNIHRVC